MAKIEESNIIVMGRSLGSGPSSHLAAKYSPAALILISPLTSIKSVASQSVGFLSALLVQQFDNLKKMHQVSCQTLIIHGCKDKMIPLEQAQQLKDRCFGPCTLVTPENMSHNRFDIYNDIARNIKSFLVQSGLKEYSDGGGFDVLDELMAS